MASSLIFWQLTLLSYIVPSWLFFFIFIITNVEWRSHNSDSGESHLRMERSSTKRTGRPVAMWQDGRWCCKHRQAFWWSDGVSKMLLGRQGVCLLVGSVMSLRLKWRVFAVGRGWWNVCNGWMEHLKNNIIKTQINVASFIYYNYATIWSNEGH